MTSEGTIRVALENLISDPLPVRLSGLSGLQLSAPPEYAWRSLRPRPRLPLRLHFFLCQNGNRVGPGLGEFVHVRSGGASVDATLVRQLPCEVCDLAVVQLPFWDLAALRELWLYCEDSDGLISGQALG